MLINFSNHPYETWSEDMRRAAAKYGETVDFPFPQLEPDLSVDELRELVATLAEKIEAMRPEAVFAAGEFTLLFMMVDKLLTDGLKVICSCSKRLTTETRLPNGANEKKSVFVFERFREYEYFKINF
ncbi:MAG: CRISPR-associated protein [Selenomonadaceae bacterium]|nr:CRISPR-associated protein [Selenomonadaceae bacterium]MBP3722617.1 CRISPR-associated protein [Selenomonadaceae bacterium]